MYMIDVVLPVLNEAEAIPRVLGSLPPGFRAIVVDNGSTDGSAKVAAEYGAMVIHEPLRGFGAACFAGLAGARTDVVAFMDCDGSLDPGELPLVTGPIENRHADLVIGTRRAQAGAWPLHARVANRALAHMVRARTGLYLDDLGPMRAARRDSLLHLELVDRRFGWPLEMILKANLAQWRITSAVVSYRPRVGRSKVTGTLRGTAFTIADMTKTLHRA